MRIMTYSPAAKNGIHARNIIESFASILKATINENISIKGERIAILIVI